MRPVASRGLVRGLSLGLSLGLSIGLLLGLPLVARANLYRYPLDGDKGTVTAYFDHSGKDWNCGTKRYSGHKGSDFAAPKGTPVYAAASGSVVTLTDGCSDSCTTGSCGCGGGFGNYVKLVHADGKHTYYAHLQIWSIKVKQGQQVNCGQQIGNVASSGNSTGNHLHFEVRVPTTSDDPYSGSCGGPLTYWVQQGPYLGRPGTQCAGPPPKLDAGPKPDTKPPPPKPDAKPPAPKPDAKLPPPKLDAGHPPPPPPASDGATVPPVWPGASGENTLSGGCSLAGSGDLSLPLALALALVVALLALATRRRRRD